MERPSPVPPYLRVVELSAWEKGWNRPALAFSFRPMPQSRTASRTTTRCGSAAPLASSIALATTSPRSVNLMALDRKLSRIWRMRVGSPMMWSGNSGAMKLARVNCFSCARAASTSRLPSTIWRSEKLVRSSTSRPASILEKSRMSLMIAINASADTLMVRANSVCSLSSGVSSSRSVMPMTPFSGVRISWLMVDRKSPLRRVASSAAFLASSRCCCNRRSSRMSENTATEPCHSPSSAKGAPVTLTGSEEPSLWKNTSSLER